MLNKQGLFTRNQDSNRLPTTINPLSNPGKAVPPVLGPGHTSTQDATNTPATANTVDAATSDNTSKHDTTTGSRLIVGPDVKLKGAEIQDCDILVVEGRVEATMDSRVIQIAEKGAFSGKVGIDVAEIRGQFDGELTARNQLIIHATGRVSGKIRYGKILIEEGGELSGDIASINTEHDSRITRFGRDAAKKD